MSPTCVCCWLVKRRTISASSHELEEELPVEEFLRRVRSPMTAEEAEETARLVAWFRRRYPTPLARLRYVRRKHREWTRPLEIQAIRES